MKPTKIRRFLRRAADAEIPVLIEMPNAKIAEGYVWSVGDETFELIADGSVDGYEFDTVDWIGLAL